MPVNEVSEATRASSSGNSAEADAKREARAEAAKADQAASDRAQAREAVEADQGRPKRDTA